MNPEILHVSERRHFALDFRRKRSMNARTLSLTGWLLHPNRADHGEESR